MRQFLAIANIRVAQESSSTQLEKMLSGVSPILEAFGNAMTAANSNSSRFGKYIEIQFGKNFQLFGAFISEYMLEKSRVVLQGPYEQVFHVFYMLLRETDAEDTFHLGPCASYTYLKSGTVSLCPPNANTPGTNDDENVFILMLHIGLFDD